MAMKRIRRAGALSMVAACAAASAVLSLAGSSIAAGDPLELFRKVVMEHARMRSVDAEITQYIQMGEGPQEIFKGRYRADSSGRFRIDYTVPSAQVVVNDGAGLYWYYPGEKLLYRIEGQGTAGHGQGPNPLREFQGKFEERFEITSEGPRLHGFFRKAHRFRVTDTRSGLTLRILVDEKTKSVLEKVVRDRAGREILKESYSDFIRTGGIRFPGRVSVMAQGARGVTRNITLYTHVVLNRDIQPSVFRLTLPPGVTHRLIHE